MIRKVIRLDHDENYVISLFSSFTKLNSKNDLPAYIYFITDYDNCYIWRNFDKNYRDNDLVSCIDTQYQGKDKIEFLYYKYGNCYKYNGYHYIECGKKLFNKKYKFICGICCKLLKEDLKQ